MDTIRITEHHVTELTTETVSAQVAPDVIAEPIYCMTGQTEWGYIYIGLDAQGRVWQSQPYSSFRSRPECDLLIPRLSRHETTADEYLASLDRSTERGSHYTRIVSALKSAIAASIERNVWWV